MKFEITMEDAEEFACCIVDNNLSRDEACDYIRNAILETNLKVSEGSVKACEPLKQIIG